MPTLLKWIYQADDTAEPAEQRVFAGDMVIYEGEHGRLDKLCGPVAHVELGMGEAKEIGVRSDSV